MSLKFSIVISGYTLVLITVCSIYNLCSSKGVPALPVTVDRNNTLSPKKACRASSFVKVFTWAGVHSSRLLYITLSADFSLIAVGVGAVILDGPSLSPANSGTATRMEAPRPQSSDSYCLLQGKWPRWTIQHQDKRRHRVEVTNQAQEKCLDMLFEIVDLSLEGLNVQMPRDLEQLP